VASTLGLGTWRRRLTLRNLYFRIMHTGSRMPSDFEVILKVFEHAGWKVLECAFCLAHGGPHAQGVVRQPGCIAVVPAAYTCSDPTMGGE
jgi:hypothetical protein